MRDEVDVLLSIAHDEEAMEEEIGGGGAGEGEADGTRASKRPASDSSSSSSSKVAKITVITPDSEEVIESRIKAFVKDFEGESRPAFPPPISYRA